jgi:CRP/FNR family cyclic AMP-dependent transcriptional regulator
MNPRKPLASKLKSIDSPAAAATRWFDPYLDRIPSGKTRLPFRTGALLYAQGQPSNAVFFIEQGKVRLSVLSRAGQEAILGTLTSGDFCGEGCLSAQPLRIGSAKAITPATIVRIQKEAMVRALHDLHPLSEAFLARLLKHNIAIEEDICDQLFNHSEKRLARALLKLARFGQDPDAAVDHTITPNISQEALAEMIGTTRSRVNHFMNKFRLLGLIEYNGKIRVHPTLLTDVVLSD